MLRGGNIPIFSSRVPDVVFHFIVPSLRFLFIGSFEKKLPGRAFDRQCNLLFFNCYLAVIRVKIYKPIAIVSKSSLVLAWILLRQNLVVLFNTGYVIISQNLVFKNNVLRRPTFEDVLSLLKHSALNRLKVLGCCFLDIYFMQNNRVVPQLQFPGMSSRKLVQIVHVNFRFFISQLG